MVPAQPHASSLQRFEKVCLQSGLHANTTSSTQSLAYDCTIVKLICNTIEQHTQTSDWWRNNTRSACCDTADLCFICQATQQGEREGHQACMMSYQRECCSNAKGIKGDGQAEDVGVLQHVEEALSLLDGGVEGRPLVVDSKGAELDDEVHHEADRVDQIWHKVRVRFLLLILHRHSMFGQLPS